MDKILDFSHATEEEEAAAKRVSQKLGLGEIYFAYNLPIQVFIGYNEEGNPKSGINLSESCIWNYMPRKNAMAEETLEELFSSSEEVTAADIKDLMIVTAAILRNLSKEMLKLGEGKIATVYYPNCEDCVVI